MAKLCIALDTNLSQALELLSSLKGYPLVFKVGYKLFISHHRTITDKVKEKGFELFLDLKLHDIPNTVKEGVLSARDLGADYLTLHISSGREALKQAVEVKGKLRLLGVSLLTSLEEEDLKDIGVCEEREKQVLNLARLALESGLEGIVCSGKEVRFLKERLERPFLAVVPGIRLEGEPPEDQKRVVSFEEALQTGADMLVMGRSILRAENPIKRVEELLLRIA
ncbi:MAG: orotidine-5'-phosphate decarboxylase [Aquificaceae bacterium]|nr:orotidine-5'-phosphate decarboxylase [Aquificaceae bacterium]MCS7196449.1 orotidine-5'-phosphate decarboxylase [Aquificaceae bacterium]MCX7990193.1 orotidine-5'-phosphate decarboxylase [Aquificaceae bacterium]MDW8032837.1 orotidine-5'-phosphate decarboxylase [Aquificaceae bacterium]MDW8294960.1 orotidine-5'-phosphate decarboxylase [Aquificaceae bacterium]